MEITALLTALLADFRAWWIMRCDLKDGRCIRCGRRTSGNYATCKVRGLGDKILLVESHFIQVGNCGCDKRRLKLNEWDRRVFRKIWSFFNAL